MAKYIFNNYYKLIHDKKRTFIVSDDDNYKSSNVISVNDSWVSMIHPAYAMMLTFFSEPVELETAVAKIAVFFEFNKDMIESFLLNLLEAKEPSHTDMKGSDSTFPVGLIIDAEYEFSKRKCYKPEDFRFTEVDCKSRRMFEVPLTLLFMPNNNCFTDCIYCYADTKRRENALSIKEIKKFIEEASTSGIQNIMLTGGDIFVYPYWQELLELLIKNGYKPDLVSTKKTLSESEVVSLAKTGIRLQFSLDTVNPDTATSILKTGKNYVENAKKTLRIIDSEIKDYQVATVITDLNGRISELNNLKMFLSTLPNLKRWDIRIAFKSLYSRGNFDHIKASRSQIKMIEKWVDENKDTVMFDMLWSPDSDITYRKAKNGSRDFEGSLCSANVNNMVILPNGDVTICEQLYWHPDFIIGNVRTKSLKEIWNSEKALSLWSRNQKSINTESSCAKCKLFDDCFSFGNRCYANIMKAYGIGNYDYPDPRCFYAPEFSSDITHK